MNDEAEETKVELPAIVSAEELRQAHKALLAKENEVTHARDALAAERRRMPRLEVIKDDVFEGPSGDKRSLLDLYEGRRHLVVYRFFYGPAVDGYRGGHGRRE